jgi:bacterial/archaeal transporter family protein
MIWILLAFSSAFFLGFYDISKKKALSHNAVWPVLFFCSFTTVIILFPFFLMGKIPLIEAESQLPIFLKALIVTSSWVFSFNAVARLPLSITAPIRASAPLFTIFMAVLFMGERPAFFQWIGIGITAISYFLFSIAGRKETGFFFRNPWILAMFLGAFLGACSGVYDKYLLQSLKYDPLTVQFWFNVYMSIIQFAMMCFFAYRKKNISKDRHFQFHPLMLLVGFLLFFADRFYFLALHNPDALVSVVTIIRRSSVIISFLWGIFIIKEHKSKTKYLAFAGIILGLIFIGLS